MSFQISASYVDVELVDNVHARLPHTSVSQHCQLPVALNNMFTVGQLCIVTHGPEQATKAAGENIEKKLKSETIKKNHTLFLFTDHGLTGMQIR